MLDIITSLSALILLSPIFFLLVIILIIANKGTPFFVQERPGRGEKIFKVIKFKTMADKYDVNGDLLPDYQRITKIGIALRKSSLDEIPQLLNVLVGNMSIVGPRPFYYLLLKRGKKQSPSVVILYLPQVHL